MPPLVRFANRKGLNGVERAAMAFNRALTKGTQ